MTRRSILSALALGIATAVAMPYAARADEYEACDAFARKREALAAENAALKCLPGKDVYDVGLAGNFNNCMKVGSGIANAVNKLIEDRLAECRLANAKTTGEAIEKPGSRVSDILKQQGAGAKTAKVTEDVDVYDKPGGDGNVTGVLRTPNTVQLAGACKKQDWCNVQGPAVPGGKGWVWGALDF